MGVCAFLGARKFGKKPLLHDSASLALSLALKLARPLARLLARPLSRSSARSLKLTHTSRLMQFNLLKNISHQTLCWIFIGFGGIFGYVDRASEASEIIANPLSLLWLTLLQQQVSSHHSGVGRRGRRIVQRRSEARCHDDAGRGLCRSVSIDRYRLVQAGD